MKNPGYRDFTCVLIGWSTPIGKFPHKDFTCVLMGGAICEKSLVPGFSSKKKHKNPVYRNLQGKFFGRYASDQNTDLRPNGGALMASLEGGGSLL